MTFDDYCKATGHYAEAGDRAMWEAATKAEREACAKLCDDMAEAYGDNSAGRALCIAADKMRSNAALTGAEGVRLKAQLYVWRTKKCTT